MAKLSQLGKESSLDTLERLFRQYLKDQRSRLNLERQYLELVLKNQGISSADRRTRNSDAATVLDVTKDILPTLDLTT